MLILEGKYIKFLFISKLGSLLYYILLQVISAKN